MAIIDPITITVCFVEDDKTKQNIFKRLIKRFLPHIYARYFIGIKPIKWLKEPDFRIIGKDETEIISEVKEIEPGTYEITIKQD